MLSIIIAPGEFRQDHGIARISYGLSPLTDTNDSKTSPLILISRSFVNKTREFRSGMT
jgi:hypothetical protein